jgi:hypothetical protein
MKQTIKIIKGNDSHMRRKKPTDTWRNHDRMKGMNNKSKSLSRFAGSEDRQLAPIDFRVQRAEDRRLKKLARQRTLTR